MVEVRINRAVVDATGHIVARRLVKDLLRDIQLTARGRAVGGQYSTGRLALSIKTRQDTTPDGETGSVYSDLYYAKYVERGARPHLILPRGPYPLHFYWRKVGHYVSLAYVNHPGQKGKHFLEDALRLNAPRHGFKIL